MQFQTPEKEDNRWICQSINKSAKVAWSIDYFKTSFSKRTKIASFLVLLASVIWKLYDMTVKGKQMD